MPTDTTEIFRILTVAPNLIQIEVLDADQFKQDASDFTIGSYLKISDDSNTSIIALVQSFKIKETTIEAQQPLQSHPLFWMHNPLAF